jgi:hypothetical protein
MISNSRLKNLFQMLFKSVLPSLQKLFHVNRTLSTLNLPDNGLIGRKFFKNTALSAPTIFLNSVPLFETVTAATAIRFENLARAYQQAASMAWSAITSKTPMSVNFNGSYLLFSKRNQTVVLNKKNFTNVH